jgi:hydroxypyruvate isomerase
MPRFSANISMMFGEVDFLDRFAAARQAGFAAVEFLFPYAHEASDIARRVTDNALDISVFNLPPGEWAKGERGLAAVPGREGDFAESLKHTLEYGRVLGARRVHCMAGVAPGGEAETEVYVDNLRRAGDVLGAQGIEVLIEPINPRDMPGYFLTTTDQALELLDRIAHPMVGLQFDIYHHQITRGDVIRTIEAIVPRISHVQIAGVPERHEPDQGELDYGPVLATLDRVGYRGWVGCEYRPRGDSVAGLGWREALG